MAAPNDSLHFVMKAGITPFLVGAADLKLLRACDEMGMPAAGVNGFGALPDAPDGRHGTRC